MEDIEWVKNLKDGEVYAIMFSKSTSLEAIGRLMKKYEEIVKESGKNIKFIALPFDVDIEKTSV